MSGSRCFRLSFIVVCAFLVTAGAGPRVLGQTADKPAPPASMPVQVLMVVGGGHHDYDTEPRQLAGNLGKQDDALKVRITSDLSEINDTARFEQ